MNKLNLAKYSTKSILGSNFEFGVRNSSDLASIPSEDNLPGILFITSYPPRECGIATYSQDLIKALENKFKGSFKISICPLESKNEVHQYDQEIKYRLNTDQKNVYVDLAKAINNDDDIQIVMIQHEFGFFENTTSDFSNFLSLLHKKVILVFHTVLPNPNSLLKINVQGLSDRADSIIVMTNSSAKILIHDYAISEEKINIIPHGTHLVTHSDKSELKKKYNLSGKIVLSTFGLLSSGKSIETTLSALPEIIKVKNNVLFLIIGKTHPTVEKQEGEKYRLMLKEKIETLGIQNHVLFINAFLPLPELLEYLQLTDIYLFTSKDPNQAVSGTFSYAISCGCPIISTPIPHAREILQHDSGIIVDFENSEQVAEAVISLLNDEQLRNNISTNGLHKIASTSWENAAIAHARVFEKITDNRIVLKYRIPVVNLDHIKKLTTGFGIIQFSKINQPDLDSGYTLDDNARALIAICQHYELTSVDEDLTMILIYFNFIKYCLQSEGYFLNYIDKQNKFTVQNNSTNLADANGRAIWALGYLISLSSILPKNLINEAQILMHNALLKIQGIYSTRAMAFVIKGLYFQNTAHPSEFNIALIKQFAVRLEQMYKHEGNTEWQWYESYLTYANSILPEAMLFAAQVTGEQHFKEIAKSSFDFLLSKMFSGNKLKVISNKYWLHKGQVPEINEGGEQPIDVAYTILALNSFYNVFGDPDYKRKIEICFNWFLGDNHLHRIIYNPCTGGCYDGLEENNVNLNQGAESTLSYLMARLSVEKNIKTPTLPTLHSQVKNFNGSQNLPLKRRDQLLYK